MAPEATPKKGCCAPMLVLLMPYLILGQQRTISLTRRPKGGCAVWLLILGVTLAGLGFGGAEVLT